MAMRVGETRRPVSLPVSGRSAIGVAPGLILAQEKGPAGPAGPLAIVIVLSGNPPFLVGVRDGRLGRRFVPFGDGGLGASAQVAGGPLDDALAAVAMAAGTAGLATAEFQLSAHAGVFPIACRDGLLLPVECLARQLLVSVKLASEAVALAHAVPVAAGQRRILPRGRQPGSSPGPSGRLGGGRCRLPIARSGRGVRFAWCSLCPGQGEFPAVHSPGCLCPRQFKLGSRSAKIKRSPDN